jgi:probable addiction module antidote protein
MATLKTFDITAHLSDPEGIAAYLDACMEEGGQELFLKALGDVIKAAGVSNVIRKAGIASRTSAYRSFSAAGKPEMRTVGTVLDTMGLRLAVVRKDASQPGPMSLVRDRGGKARGI